MPRPQQSLCKVGTDETRAAGDQCSHDLQPVCRSWDPCSGQSTQTGGLMRRRGEADHAAPPSRIRSISDDTSYRDGAVAVRERSANATVRPQKGGAVAGAVWIVLRFRSAGLAFPSERGLHSVNPCSRRRPSRRRAYCLASAGERSLTTCSSISRAFSGRL